MATLTPIDMAQPLRVSETIARVGVSLSLMAWLGVALTLFWG